MFGDTIAAIATGSAPGGVGVIRVSGPQAIEIVAAVIGVDRADFGREVRFAIARDRNGARLDEVLAFAMRAPKSFTGEDVAELHGHGGVANMARLLATVLEWGARAAEPGEFTRRAFDNGKLDLPRAEALLAVIEAGSERAVRVNQQLLAGAISEALDELEEKATEVLAEIEGSIDFPDEDLVLAPSGWAETTLRELASRCSKWVATFATGKALRHGITVALVGEVNVGKSSLLNALCNQSRAIVSPQPGTTRDYLEVRVEWSGVPVTLVDTAGVRSSTDPIEAAGIELGKKRAAEADVVLALREQTAVTSEQGTESEKRTIHVVTKCDDGVGHGVGAIATSARTGVGLDQLKQEILAVASVGALDGDDGVILISERQSSIAREAAERFAKAADSLHAQLPLDLLALDVRQAVACLAQMRGKEVTERVLDEVFARFCIGK